MELTKPASIKASEFKSAKWDELTTGRNFTQADAPVIEMLCTWYEVVEQCMVDISDYEGVHIAYTNENGDVKAFPQLATMKQASAEIRALNKQLNINDQVDTTERKPTLNVLEKVQGEYENQKRTKKRKA
ncbi:MAG: hypothetical protein MJ060_04195, partial [Clostridia bacterium]|nr:hypothetical protein [Clostridia bacterium]